MLPLCSPHALLKISAMLLSTQREMASLGAPTNNVDQASQGELLLRLVSNFASSFTSLMDGRGAGGGLDMEQLNELYGGARVSYIFNEVFSKTMLHVTPFEGVCACVFGRGVYNIHIQSSETRK